MLTRSHSLGRRNWSARVVALVCAVAALSAISAAPAGATGPSYPGETLSLALQGSSVQGQVTTIVASGNNADDNGCCYDLWLYAKDANVDNTCAASQADENNTWGNDMGHETVLATASDETYGAGSFSVVVKKVFDGSGPVLLCGYTNWSYDTAANAQLSFTVLPSGGGASGGGGGGTTSPGARPTTVTKPRVSRAGTKLICTPGQWSNAGKFSYTWLVNRKVELGARGRQLRISAGLHGHKVQCRVTASNAAGKTTAVSSPYRVP